MSVADGREALYYGLCTNFRLRWSYEAVAVNVQEEKPWCYCGRSETVDTMVRRDSDGCGYQCFHWECVELEEELKGR